MNVDLSVIVFYFFFMFFFFVLATYPSRDIDIKTSYYSTDTMYCLSIHPSVHIRIIYIVCATSVRSLLIPSNNLPPSLPTLYRVATMFSPLERSKENKIRPGKPNQQEIEYPIQHYALPYLNTHLGTETTTTTEQKQQPTKQQNNIPL